MAGRLLCVMPGYGKFCPVSMGGEVVADRWTPLILRELILGSTRFNDIARGLPGISRSLLVQRLGHLERKGVLERWPSATGRGSEYRLTPAGKDLENVVMALGEWSVEWLYNEMEPRAIDPITLTWWMHHRVDPAALPPDRVSCSSTTRRPERVTHGSCSSAARLGLQSAPGVRQRRHRDVHVSDVVGCVQRCRVVGPRRRHRGDPCRRPARLTRALPRWFLCSPFGHLVAERAAMADDAR